MTADFTPRQLEAFARIDAIRVANKARYARAKARKAAKAANSETARRVATGAWADTTSWDVAAFTAAELLYAEGRFL